MEEPKQFENLQDKNSKMPNFRANDSKFGIFNYSTVTFNSTSVVCPK